MDFSVSEIELLRMVLGNTLGVAVGQSSLLIGRPSKIHQDFALKMKIFL